MNITLPTNLVSFINRYAIDQTLSVVESSMVNYVTKPNAFITLLGETYLKENSFTTSFEQSSTLVERTLRNETLSDAHRAQLATVMIESLACAHIEDNPDLKKALNNKDASKVVGLLDNLLSSMRLLGNSYWVEVLKSIRVNVLLTYKQWLTNLKLGYAENNLGKTNLIRPFSLWKNIPEGVGRTDTKIENYSGSSLSLVSEPITAPYSREMRLRLTLQGSVRVVALDSDYKPLRFLNASGHVVSDGEITNQSVKGTVVIPLSLPQHTTYLQVGFTITDNKKLENPMLVSGSVVGTYIVGE